MRLRSHSRIPMIWRDRQNKSIFSNVKTRPFECFVVVYPRPLRVRVGYLVPVLQRRISAPPAVMPLVKRAVAPVFISRAVLDKQVKNELEGVVVNSLAGLIKQLSNVSKHAENLFSDLFTEAGAIFQRTAALNQRVQTLRERVVKLDATTADQSESELAGHHLPCLVGALGFPFLSRDWALGGGGGGV